ncbi:MAG: DNA repair protein RecN [Eubacteriales bacterium]|nr:DNA repair protein RecN [Eubacteriales bacterium]
MLLELNVKNIALIKDISVTFEKGLNIMTGETGTGKSVIIGSAVLCMGGKAKTDIIRKGADYAYVEMVFSLDDSYRRKKLEEMGFSVEDGIISLSRKIMPQRSINKINGETVNLSMLREVSGLFIDIYGQNEHQSLLNNKKHLEILDMYMGDEAEEILIKQKALYKEWQDAKHKLEKFDLDEKQRLREIDIDEYELEEIDNAKISENEEEELLKKYKKLKNARNIIEYVNNAYEYIDSLDIGIPSSEINHALKFDDSLKEIYDTLCDADSILSGIRRELREYIENIDIDEEDFALTEQRLDEVRNIKAKYGQSFEEITSYRNRLEERLNELYEYDKNLEKAKKQLADSFNRLEENSRMLHEKRMEFSLGLCNKVREELLELGFNSVELELAFEEKTPQADGKDIVTFCISLNLGEKKRPIGEACSGGELSRIMLAIKTVLSKSDGVSTLIFDEIDTGISGRTAQRVSEKLHLIALEQQVICITHLPQIAAMADIHFVIKKYEQDGRNTTVIEKLAEANIEEELARLLGGAELTSTVYENAREMKKLADKYKNKQLHNC